MPLYAWQAINLQGATVQGRSWAHNQHHLAHILVREDLGYLSSTLWQLSWVKTIGRQQALMEMWNALYILLSSGLTMQDALQSIDTADSVLAAMLRTWHEGLMQGYSLTECIEPFIPLIGKTPCAILQVGVVSGNITHAVHIVLQMQQEKIAYIKQVSQALFSPCMTLLSLIIAWIGIVVFLLPQLELLTADMRGSSFIIMRLPIWLYRLQISCLLIIAIGLLLFLIYRKFLALRMIIDSSILRIPFIGRLLGAMHLYIIWQQLAMLTAANIPIVNAVPLIAEGSKNRYIAGLLLQWVELIVQGKPLQEACQLTIGSMMPSGAIMLLRITHKTGNFAQQSQQIATLLHQQVTKTLHTFVSLLNPVALVITGIAIATLAVWVMEPLMALPDILMKM